MSSNVEKLLKSHLSADTPLVAQIATRIYPVHVPQNAALPYVVYNRVSTEFVNDNQKYSGSGVAAISVSSWAQTYSGAKALADLVRAAINGWRDHGGSPKIDLATLNNEYDAVLAPEDGNEFPIAYGVVHDINVSFEES